MLFSAAVVVLFGVRMLAQPAIGGSAIDMNPSFSPDGRRTESRLVARAGGDAPGVAMPGAVTHVYKSTENGDLRLHVGALGTR
jgi:hypothetical protein